MRVVASWHLRNIHVNYIYVNDTYIYSGIGRDNSEMSYGRFELVTDLKVWFVATEIDLNSTYVGGSPAAIAELLASPQLAAYPVSPGDPIDSSSDAVNPAPPGPG